MYMYEGRGVDLENIIIIQNKITNQRFLPQAGNKMVSDQEDESWLGGLGAHLKATMQGKSEHSAR